MISSERKLRSLTILSFKRISLVKVDLVTGKKFMLHKEKDLKVKWLSDLFVNSPEKRCQIFCGKSFLLLFSSTICLDSFWLWTGNINFNMFVWIFCWHIFVNPSMFSLEMRPKWKRRIENRVKWILLLSIQDFNFHLNINKQTSRSVSALIETTQFSFATKLSIENWFAMLNV